MTCKGKTKAGTPCRAAAGESGFCFLHANPDSARALGQLGGRKNRRPAALDINVPDNITVAALSKLNTEVMQSLLSGQLRAREAAAFVQLSNLQLRLLQGTGLEARVATLETQLATEQARASTETDDITQEADVAVDVVDRAAEAVAVADSEVVIEPVGEDNVDLAEQTGDLNAAGADASTRAEEEDRDGEEGEEDQEQ
jgi:hypothetical protein